jgi:hypothetical protein
MWPLIAFGGYNEAYYRQYDTVMQEQIGHPSINMTLGTYSAYVPSVDRSAVQRMETLRLKDRQRQ